MVALVDYGINDSDTSYRVVHQGCRVRSRQVQPVYIAVTEHRTLLQNFTMCTDLLKDMCGGAMTTSPGAEHAIFRLTAITSQDCGMRAVQRMVHRKNAQN
jgi:hypothetical protein